MSVTNTAPNATEAVENPIINSPFVEPQCYWEIKKGEQPRTVAGRRGAYYYYRVPDSAKRGRKNNQLSFEGDLGVGQKEELPIANWLRKQLEEWRRGALTGIAYDGASDMTKELLRLWKAEEGRYQRLFFAQVEAAETIIFLTEANPVYHKGMPPIPVDQPGKMTQAAGFQVIHALRLQNGDGHGQNHRDGDVVGMVHPELCGLSDGQALYRYHPDCLPQCDDPRTSQRA